MNQSSPNDPAVTRENDRYNEILGEHRNDTGKPDWNYSYGALTRKYFVEAVEEWNNTNSFFAVPRDRLLSEARRKAERVINRAIHEWNFTHGRQ